ncbi:MAG: hypothetical protein EBU62_14520 [Proteobacteria bacterium]|nr:hypothetical protein [Pseudomonadota bacterium]
MSDPLPVWRVEYADAGVPGVGNVRDAMGIDRNPRRAVESEIVRSAMPKGVQELAVEVKRLDPVVLAVRDKRGATPDGDAIGNIKLTRV